MLILTRRPNELLTIGDKQIQIKVLEVRGGRVRLGITAPPEVTVRRQDVTTDCPTSELAAAR
ncbi:MAG: carbon storage regulator [Planctomycetaceae bacterium]|nr:carbon storage regulator [Planctomycetaceae bacterium]